MNATTPQLLAADEVAKQLSLSVSMVYKLAERGTLSSVRVGRGVVRFEQAEVDAFIARQRVPVAGAE